MVINFVNCQLYLIKEFVSKRWGCVWNCVLMGFMYPNNPGLRMSVGWVLREELDQVEAKYLRKKLSVTNHT